MVANPFKVRGDDDQSRVRGTTNETLRGAGAPADFIGWLTQPLQPVRRRPIVQQTGETRVEVVEAVEDVRVASWQPLVEAPRVLRIPIQELPRGPPF